MPKLSIIVPVYNVEKYLDQCIRSILSQTFTDFELILVDDGSTDESGKICDDYALKDNRVVVIHKANEGLVRARKTGIEKSTGEYVTHVDSDDWIDETTYEDMFLQGEDADVIICGMVKEYDTYSEEVSNEIETGLYVGERLTQLHSKLLYTGEFYKASLFPAVWNKIYKREVVYANQMAVADGTRMGEDAMCTYPTILDAKSVMVLNNIHPYHYRRQGETMSNSYDKNYFERVHRLITELAIILKDKKTDNIMEQLDYYNAFLLCIGVEQEFCVSKKKVKNSITYLKEITKNHRIKEVIGRLDMSGFQKEQEKVFDLWKRERYVSLYVLFLKKRVLLKLKSLIK